MSCAHFKQNQNSVIFLFCFLNFYKLFFSESGYRHKNMENSTINRLQNIKNFNGLYEFVKDNLDFIDEDFVIYLESKISKYENLSDKFLYNHIVTGIKPVQRGFGYVFYNTQTKKVKIFNTKKELCKKFNINQNTPLPQIKKIMFNTYGMDGFLSISKQKAWQIKEINRTCNYFYKSYSQLNWLRDLVITGEDQINFYDSNGLYLANSLDLEFVSGSEMVKPLLKDIKKTLMKYFSE